MYLTIYVFIDIIIAYSKQKEMRNFMNIYLLFKIQEQLYYVSVVAEIVNILYYLSIIFGISLPHGFSYGLLLFNAIYSIYMFLVIFFTRGKFKTSAFMIITLAILKSFIWESIPIISIIDSLICIGILIYYHQFLYVAIEQIEKEIKEGEA